MAGFAKTVAVAALGVVAVPGWPGATAAQTGVPDSPPRRHFYKDSRADLALARARGDTAVTVVIAAVPGRNDAVARAVARVGGVVRYRDDDVSYIRARVPVAHISTLSDEPAVQTADLDIDSSCSSAETCGGRTLLRANAANPYTRTAGLPVPQAPAAAPDTGRKDWPPTWPPYPLTHPYHPLEDLGAAEFRDQHPTFDGRGVTVALLDGNIDLLLPELQTALSLDGRPVPKVLDYVNVLDPEVDEAGQWVSMKETVTARGGRFTYGSESYTAPHDGTFRIGMFNERALDSSYMGQDMNRDGNPEGSDSLFAVLWDEDVDDVWVDTDQDRSLTDERAMTDYRLRRDVGQLGTDDPATRVRETIPFAVQIDRDGKYVALNVGYFQHGTAIAGVVAGSRGSEGRFDGVAPGAQLVSIWYGGTTHGLVEGLIRAFKDPNIDIVLLEQNVFIARPYLLGDGRFTPSVITSRLIEQYQKPFLVPADNNSSLNSVTEHGQARHAIAVGAYQSKESYLVNMAVRVEHEDNLHFVGSYGPAGNGALKPDILSPSYVLSTDPAFRWGAALDGVYRLPPGYTISGGTSTATPTAAGAVALLISAAKQSGVAYDPERLHHALTTSARFIPRLPAYKQGNGLIQVGAAWEILKSLDHASTTVRITSRASVRTVTSPQLPTPNWGVGLWEREGWRAGHRRERSITFTRTTGPSEPMTFGVTWEGNQNGTFSSARSLSLPLNVPVDFEVAIAPQMTGVHSALLSLEHPSVPGYAHRMLATIVAAEPLDAERGYTIKKEAEVPRPGTKSFYFEVPAGVTALKIDLQVPKGTIRLQVNRPDNRPEDIADFGRITSGKISHVALYPMPGVWEIVLWNIDDAFSFDFEERGLEPLKPTPVTLTVSALDAEVTIASGTPAEVAAGATATVEVGVKNRMAEFTGAVTSAALGSVYRAQRTILEQQQQVYELRVEPGSTLLSARIRGASDPQADLDLYLIDCTGKVCLPVKNGAGPRSEESVSIDDPAPGVWKVVVDAPSVPARSTMYQYVDLVLNPMLGAVSVADVTRAHPVGAQWTAKAHVWSAAPTHAGRFPYAALIVRGRDMARPEPFLVGWGGARLSSLAVRTSDP